jgi:hypothetical protein
LGLVAAIWPGKAPVIASPKNAHLILAGGTLKAGRGTIAASASV